MLSSSRPEGLHYDYGSEGLHYDYGSEGLRYDYGSADPQVCLNRLDDPS
jgi:hypothetical protein